MSFESTRYCLSRTRDAGRSRNAVASYYILIMPRAPAAASQEVQEIQQAYKTAQDDISDILEKLMSLTGHSLERAKAGCELADFQTTQNRARSPWVQFIIDDSEKQRVAAAAEGDRSERNSPTVLRVAD
jgi:hypothetical protein